MSAFFYRFRRTEHLLGTYKELEKQEIYFAHPGELNDPMEGYKELRWEGDQIVWRNLLKHYLLCLMLAFSSAVIAQEQYDEAIVRKLVLATPGTLPTDTLKAIYRQLCDTFFAQADLGRLPALLAACAKPFRRRELMYFIGALHGVALNTVMRVFRAMGLFPASGDTTAGRPSVGDAEQIAAVLRVLTTISEQSETIDEGALGTLFEGMAQVLGEAALGRYLAASTPLERAWHSLFYGFPEQYINALGDLLYFDWYAACFMGVPPQDMTTWSHYGDSHRGVSLKFKASDTTPSGSTLRLHGVSGWSGSRGVVKPVYGDIQLTFQSVTYSNTLQEIDFFRSIGRLPIPALKETWYLNEASERSECADSVLQGQDEWRGNYWTRFRTLTTTKLKTWQPECEHRLVLTSSLGSYDDRERRKLTYQFADLEGVIFGIRTPLDNKREIIETIREKCRVHRRTNFEFAQACYAPTTGAVELKPLRSIRAAAL